MSSNELKTCFAHISRFESLESLQFRGVIRYKIEPSDYCLAKCLLKVLLDL